VTPNAVCWVGTESGNPGGEIWSTGSSDKGDPDSSVWCPKGCDTTLQNGDVWFYEKGSSIRSLAQLISVYHATVGMNGMLELDFAIDRDGLVSSDHAARYKELGDWIRTCYVTGMKYKTSGTCVRGKDCILEIDIPSVHMEGTSAITIDRSMVQENLSQGQRVRSFKVDLVTSSGAVVPLGSGHSVGNKRINVGKPVDGVTKAQLTVLDFKGDSIDITNFAVFAPCPSA
jgi:alpha-L-fucosidase